MKINETKLITELFVKFQNEKKKNGACFYWQIK